MNLSEFHFLRPGWLLALLPLAFGLWRLSRSQGGASAWRGLVDAHLLPHLLAGEDSRARSLPLMLLAVGGVIGVLALAGPVWERLPQPAYQAQNERVIVLDISPDMNATDLPPSRLAHARFEVMDLLQRFREGQTALIAYGAEPFVVSPLTGDTRTIAAQVPSLSTELLPVQGPKRTGLALEEAGRLLDQAGSVQGQVILLTDGLDNPADALNAARELNKHGYRLSILGVGTTAGSPVPVQGGGFLKDAGGTIAVPKLNGAVLRELASAGGGRYLTATMDNRDIEALAQGAPVKPSETTDTNIAADQWREEGPWLVLLLLPLAAVAFRRGWIAPLVFVVFLLPAPRADAVSWSDLWLRPDQQAAKLLEQGNTKDAAQTFRRQDWRAAAAYEAGDYDNALKALDTGEPAGAWYNRGNTLARLGSYQQAIAAYDHALVDNPNDADAQHNRDLVRRLLEQQQQPKSQSSTGEQNPENGSTEQQQDAAAQNATGQSAQENESAASSQDQGSSDSGGNADRQQQQDKSAAASTGAQDTQQQADSSSAGPTPSDTTEAETPQSEQTSQSGNEGASGQDSARQAASVKPPTGSGDEPGLADLLDQPRGPRPDRASGVSQPLTEAQQAMENQLNRVPDDPAGLLRQRFLLQHLRRHGQL